MAKPIQFTSRIRYWNEEAQSGLAVADIPSRCVDALGGRRQTRVLGTLNGKPFAGATMLVAGGAFCVGVTRAAMVAAGVGIGDKVVVILEPVATSR